MSSDVPIAVIAAVADNGVIGRDNRLPWRIPTDLGRFRALTLGKPLIMGRCTFESIGRPLPGRTSIVLTREHRALPEGCIAAASLAEAIERARTVAVRDGAAEIIVAGGAAVYRETLPLAARVYLTRVRADVPGDAVFPPLGPQWVVTAEETPPRDPRDEHAVTFLTLVRR